MEEPRMRRRQGRRSWPYSGSERVGECVLLAEVSAARRREHVPGSGESERRDVETKLVSAARVAAL